MWKPTESLGKNRQIREPTRRARSTATGCGDSLLQGARRRHRSEFRDSSKVPSSTDRRRQGPRAARLPNAVATGLFGSLGPARKRGSLMPSRQTRRSQRATVFWPCPIVPAPALSRHRRLPFSSHAPPVEPSAVQRQHLRRRPHRSLCLPAQGK